MNTFFLCPITKALNCLGFFTEDEKDQNIHIFNSIEEKAKDWLRLVPENHPLSLGACLAYERCYPKNIKPVYALIYKDQVPVFAATLQNIRINPENIRKHNRGEIIRLATNLVLNVYELNLLICGNVFKDGLTGFYYEPPLFSIEEANAAVLKCIEKITREDCFTAVMLKDVPTGIGFTTDNRNITLANDISMYLPILPEWKSLEDYQKDLSKKYAARAKKILLSASAITVKELSLTEIQQYQSQLHILYGQIIEQQAFAFGKLEPEFFLETKKAFPDQYAVKGLFLEDQLVAFYTTFEQNKELEVHYVGIDYQFNSSHNLYFYIHFLALKEAIQKSKCTLHMGRTSLEAKAILGCKPKYNNTSLYFLNSIAEKSFHYFNEYLTETENWKTRNPLKSAPVEATLEEVKV